MARDDQNPWGTSSRDHRQQQHEEMDARPRSGRDRPRGAGGEGTSQHHDSHEHQEVGHGHAQHEQAGQRNQENRQDQQSGQSERRYGKGYSGRNRSRGGTDTRELGENEHMGRQYGGESAGHQRSQQGRQRGGSDRRQSDRQRGPHVADRRHDVGQNQDRSRKADDERDVHSMSHHGGSGGQYSGHERGDREGEQRGGQQTSDEEYGRQERYQSDERDDRKEGHQLPRQ